MKMKKWFFAAVVIIAAVLMAVCTSAGGGRAQVELPPVPEGAERITLENGAYAIFRFDLPPGTTWSNYNRLTVEYMLDEENLAKRQRNNNNVRLMGNYREGNFRLFDGAFWAFNLGGEGAGNANGPYIMDNTPRTFASMGAVANEWFTVEYNITGSAAHEQFVRANIPAPGDTGPFFFGVGIPGMFEGRRNGITQLVRNVTLHHSTNPALNAVSTGSGFDQPAYVSFFPVLSRREGPAVAAE
jgi:hypothetical protein